MPLPLPCPGWPCRRGIKARTASILTTAEARAERRNGVGSAEVRAMSVAKKKRAKRSVVVVVWFFMMWFRWNGSVVLGW